MPVYKQLAATLDYTLRINRCCLTTLFYSNSILLDKTVASTRCYVRSLGKGHDEQLACFFPDELLGSVLQGEQLHKGWCHLLNSRLLTCTMYYLQQKTECTSAALGARCHLLNTRLMIRTVAIVTVCTAVPHGVNMCKTADPDWFPEGSQRNTDRKHTLLALCVSVQAALLKADVNEQLTCVKQLRN